MSNIIHIVNLINGAVNYIDPLSAMGENIKFAQQTIPTENETLDIKTFEETKLSIPLVSELSTRNHKNTYIIPTEKKRVLLNLIPQKVFVTDQDINNYIDVKFHHFEFDINNNEAEAEPFSMIDGLIFRYVENGPKPIDQYTYYVMEDGVLTQIPNFKSLEVMLFQRNENYNSVRIIEKSQFEDILSSSESKPGSDMSAQWTAEMEDQVNIGKYLDLLKGAQSAGAIAASATAEADKNIKAVKAEKDAEKAKAEQAKAEADAAKAKADAAIEEAKAAQAKANAAEAEAKQKQSEADAKKAEYEAQIPPGN